jgi:hypothetical protein
VLAAEAPTSAYCAVTQPASRFELLMTPLDSSSAIFSQQLLPAVNFAPALFPAKGQRLHPLNRRVAALLLLLTPTPYVSALLAAPLSRVQMHPCALCV